MKDAEQTTPPPRLSTFAKFMIALLLAFAVLLAFRMHKAVQDAKRAKTRALLATCGLASQAFYTSVNRWPIALPELVTHTNGPFIFMRNNPGFLDSWGRPLLYVAPAGTNAGSITSLGEDGLPGGTNNAADITFTIPLPVGGPKPTSPTNELPQTPTTKR